MKKKRDKSVFSWSQREARPGAAPVSDGRAETAASLWKLKGHRIKQNKTNERTKTFTLTTNINTVSFVNDWLCSFLTIIIYDAFSPEAVYKDGQSHSAP